MRKKRMPKATQILIGALLIILAILLSALLMFKQAMSPYTRAKTSAISLAKKKTPVTDVTYFDMVTTQSTTYSVIGLDKQKQTLGVLIPEKGGDIVVVNMADNHSELTPKTAKLTLYKNQVVWVSKDLTLYDFKTGDKVTKN